MPWSWKRPSWQRIAIGSLVLLVVAWAGIQITLRSDWFEEQLRVRVIAELEQATGGNAQLETLRFDPSSMTVELVNLRISGPDQTEPFAELPSVSLGLSVESLLSRRVRLDHLALESPLLRLQIAEDGSTNWPARTEAGPSLSLTDIGLGHLDVTGASFIFNGEPYDLDLSADDVVVTAELDQQGCYEFNASAQDIRGASEDWYSDSVLSTEIRLCGDRLVVGQLEFVTANFGTWSGSGSAQPVTNPVVDFEFSFDGPLASFLPGLPDGWAIEGVAASVGSITRTPSEPVSYAGTLGVYEIGIAGPSGTITDARLDAAFTGDLDTLEVSSLNLSLANGTVVGRANVTDLRGQWRLTSAGRLEAVGVDAIVQTVTTRFPWAALATGPYEFSASERAGLQLSSSLDFSDPDDVVSPGVTGQAAFEYFSRDGELLLHSFDIAAEGIELAANGTLSASEPTEVVLDIRADSHRDVEALLAVVDDSAGPLPFALEGATAVTMILSSPTGLFPFADVQVEADVSTGAIRYRDYRWQRLAVSVDLLGGRLVVRNGRAADGTGSIEFSATASIEMGGSPSDWPFTLHAEATDLDASRLAVIVGLTTAATGSLEATADFHGPWRSLACTADFLVRDGSAANFPFDSLTGSIAYQSGRLGATRIEVRRGDALLSGEGSYLVDERAFDLNIVGSNMKLEEVPIFGERPAKPHGQLSLDVTANGVFSPADSPTSFDALAVEGSWRMQGLELSEVQLGDWSGEVTSSGDRIDLTLSGMPLNGSVSGAAAVDIAQLGFATDIRFENLAIGGLISSAGEVASGPTGVATGEAQFRGSLNSLSDTDGEGLFSELRLEIADLPGSDAGYELYNPFPMRWTFSDGQLSLDHMRLQGTGANVELTGAVGLAPGVDSDLRIDGDFDLAALEQFRPMLTASGRSTIGVRLTGPLTDPSIQGEWVIQDGGLQSAELPAGLSAVNGKVQFIGREFRVEELRAVSGGGALTVSGGGRIDPEDYEFRLDGRAEGVRVRYPVGVVSLVDGDFVFSGGADQRLLSGEVMVLRLSTPRTTTLSSFLSGLRPRRPTSSQSAPLDSVQVNVHVASAPGVEFDTPLIRNVVAAIDLRVVGTLGNRSLLGQIDISQGQMSFHGSRYAINRGQIEFRNPVRVEPLLDFEIETRMRGIDIALILAGPARRLNVSYRSDPPLAFSELVNLIAVGRDPSTDPLYSSRQRIEQQSLFQTGANNVLANAVQSPVSPGLQRFFGVSRLKVDPGAGGVGADPAARISTEQPLAEDVTLIYTYDLSSSRQQTFRLEWTPDRRWTFVATRDENGIVGSDAIYKLRRP